MDLLVINFIMKYICFINRRSFIFPFSYSFIETKYPRQYLVYVYVPKTNVEEHMPLVGT